MSLSASVAALDTRQLFPQVGAQKQVNLPLRTAGVEQLPHPSAELYTNPVLFIAETGDPSARAASQLCNNLNNTFDTRAYDASSGTSAEYAAVGTSSSCTRDLQTLLRDQRGLAMLHEPVYASAVFELESTLARDSYFTAEFETNVWRKPFRARALHRLAQLTLRGSGSSTYCEVGFGAGHSALLVLSSFPRARVLSYDLGLAPITMAAHELLDEAYPERLYLTVGDSYLTLPRMRDYFQTFTCDLIYLDGSTLYTSVVADVRALAHVADENTIVAAAAARRGSDVARAWGDLVETGVLAWEGSMYETPGVPESDAIVYARFVNATLTAATFPLN